MSKHLLWVWIWFLIGMMSYWLKRAYYLVTGPNPIANTYTQFVQRCWIPLGVRGLLESLLFWILFTPGLADKALESIGWASYGWAVQIVTTIAPAAAILGHTMDSIMDMAVSKIPLVNTVLPQMPGPLPKPPAPNPGP